MVVLPNTTTPPEAVVVRPIVPVHVAPMAQQAMFRAWSRVQTEPEVQQAPPSAAARVEQEL